jgi:hypothetical protein
MDEAMVVSALGTVFHARGYRYLALGLFLLGLTFYLVTLPATHTGGAIGVAALRYLNGELVMFAFLLASPLSMVLTLNVYSIRTALLLRGTKLSIGAVLASLVPGSVCCTPLVPVALAAIGASTPQIFSLTGRIQGTVARYEALFLVLSILLLLVALRLAAQGVCESCQLPEGRSVIDGSREGALD